MFNKKKGGTIDLTTENITTIIAENCKIEGTIECKEFIRVDGQSIGGINSSGGIILGEKGIIKGDIRTKELIVYGKIDGDIYVDNLTIKTTGSVSGNMHVKSFQVESGAMYNGTVDMEQTSISESKKTIISNEKK